MMHPTSDQLLAYIDRELPLRSAREIAEHTAACSTCKDVLAQMSATSGTVLGVLERIDAAEPAEWASGASRKASAPLGVQRVPHVAKKSPLASGALRRAAGILLLTSAGAAAAVVITSRNGPGPDTTVAPAAPQQTPVSAGSASGIMVEPRDGKAIVVITGAAAQSRVLVVVEDRSDVRLVVTGGSPRFTAAAGRIDAELSGLPAELRLLVPVTLTEGSVVMGNDTIAVVRSGRVQPANAATEGIVLMGPRVQ
jgi:anti-sigma factor RsiW